MPLVARSPCMRTARMNMMRFSAKKWQNINSAGLEQTIKAFVLASGPGSPPSKALRLHLRSLGFDVDAIPSKILMNAVGRLRHTVGAGASFTGGCHVSEWLLHIGRRNTKNVKFSLSYHQRRSRLTTGTFLFLAQSLLQIRHSGRGLRFSSVLTRKCQRWRKVGALEPWVSWLKMVCEQQLSVDPRLHLASVPSGTVPRPQ